MSTLKRYTFPLAAGFVLIPLMLAGTRTRMSVVTAENELPAVNIQGQQNQALELSEGRTLASEEAVATDVRKEVLAAVKKSLPKRFRGQAFEIAKTVIIEANHHLMDPFFLLAVIKTESHFNIKARGRHGEVGLMQLLPETAQWLAPQAGLKPGRIDLEDPKTNIRLGATYLAALRKSFGGYSSRYIGAYNMGATNVRRLMALDMDPQVYPGKVLKNYQGFYRELNASSEKSGTDIVKTKATVRSKKLQTRAVVPKCRTTKCPTFKHQPIMPNWIST